VQQVMSFNQAVYGAAGNEKGAGKCLRFSDALARTPKR